MAERRTGVLTADMLTALLVERVLGWRVGPDRYMMADRQWLKQERFQPTKSIDAACRLLIALRPIEYTFGGAGASDCWAKVRLKGMSGEAASPSLPLAICLAIARALGIDVEAAN